MDINMKEELYYYAYNENYTENIKDLKIKKKQSVFVCIILLFLSIIFSLPILFENIMLWFFITIICVCVLLFNGREKNAYIKLLLTFAVVLFYFGFIVACDIDISSQIKFQISRQEELIITPIVGFLIYDIGVIISIILKKYSTKKTKEIKVKISRNSWDYIGPLLGASIGRSLSHKFGNVPVLDWILILICSIAFTLVLIFLQKYLICKFLYSKRIKNH